MTSLVIQHCLYMEGTSPVSPNTSSTASSFHPDDASELERSEKTQSFRCFSSTVSRLLLGYSIPVGILQRHSTSLHDFQIMNDFIHSLNCENKKTFFRLKSFNLKIVKAISAVDFNQNCIREHLCPRSISH